MKETQPHVTIAVHVAGTTLSDVEQGRARVAVVRTDLTLEDAAEYVRRQAERGRCTTVTINARWLRTEHQ